MEACETGRKAQVHQPRQPRAHEPGTAFHRYNRQLAVDRAHRIVVAQRLTTHDGDQADHVPLLDATTAALGRKPHEVSAYAGFVRRT